MRRRFFPSLCIAAAFVAGCDVPPLTLVQLIPVALLDGSPSPKVEFDVPYVTRGDKTLILDIFTPKKLTDIAPGLILVHGGSWTQGDRWFIHAWAADLATQGYVAFVPQYRLLNEGGQLPGNVADVIAAVGYVREHAAEYNVDPDRLALFGVSAGAYLALMAGMPPDASIFESSWPQGRPTDVRAIVDISGPTDFVIDLDTIPFYQQILIEDLIGGTQKDMPQAWEAASPVTYVRADGPPIFIAHGMMDFTVQFTQSTYLRDALDSAGQPYEYIPVPGADHDFGAIWFTPQAQSIRPALLRFLRDHLQ